MSQYDFTALENVYPQIIAAMPDPFTSHKFILALAQRHPRLYIDALSAYSAALALPHNPFQVVHGQLAERLRRFAEYVNHVQSTDIFGQSNTCALWRKRP